jgi:ABC-type Zn uptake system ZnuABC Zn-binding protein ZnuA
MLLTYLKTIAPRHWAMPLLLIAATLLGACGKGAPTAEQPERYAVSIAPLRGILSPIVGNVPIHVITPAGASPHTYEPKPSDAKRAAEAVALFHVDESLDGWVARLQSPLAIPLLPLVPEALLLHTGEAEVHTEADGSTHIHHEGAVDPHFWADPLTVAAMVEPLAERLAELRPERATEYRENAVRFKQELEALHAEATEILAPARGGQVAVFHHAIDYLLHRHDIGVAGAVEPSPGQTAGPRTLHELAQHLKAEGVKAVFMEPQLPPQSAYAVAEEAHLKVVEIDPNGGVPGRETYRELVLFNARAVRSAFE